MRRLISRNCGFIDKRIGDGIRRGYFTYPSPRLLKDIVKLPLLACEPPEKIRQVWLERHSDDASRHGFVLDSERYKILMNNSKAFPRFIFPVHRPNGFNVLYSEWQDRQCILTGLDAYRTQGAQAHPICVLTCYEELELGKGIVLARIDITDPVLTKKDAIILGNNVLDTFTRESKFSLVKQFNLQPNEFDFQDYINKSRPLDFSGKQ